jgi:hypothetical protein
VTEKTPKQICDEECEKINADYNVFATPFRKKRDEANEAAKILWQAAKKAANDAYAKAKAQPQRDYLVAIEKAALERDMKLADAWIRFRIADRAS